MSQSVAVDIALSTAAAAVETEQRMLVLAVHDSMVRRVLEPAPAGTSVADMGQSP